MARGLHGNRRRRRRALSPELPTDFDELAKAVMRHHDAGSTSSVVVVAEGALAERSWAHPRIAGSMVSRELTQRTGYETRLTVLGHVQRAVLRRRRIVFSQLVVV